MIFHVSHDSATRDSENFDERNAHLAKNADHQRHQDVEAAYGANEHGPPHHGHNLEEEFDMVADQPIH
jgi:hypothetical protein